MAEHAEDTRGRGKLGLSGLKISVHSLLSKPYIFTRSMRCISCSKLQILDLISRTRRGGSQTA